MYQKVVIVGYLGTDPEMRFTPSGIPVTSFRVAVNRRWTSGDGQLQEKTTWFRVTAWRKLAEQCNQYLSKGRLVLVEGDVDVSAWLDSEGNPRATLELTARNVRFLGGRQGEGMSGGTTEIAEPGGDFLDDDVPF